MENKVSNNNTKCSLKCSLKLFTIVCLILATAGLIEDKMISSVIFIAIAAILGLIAVIIEYNDKKQKNQVNEVINDNSYTNLRRKYNYLDEKYREYWILQNNRNKSENDINKIKIIEKIELPQQVLLVENLISKFKNNNQFANQMQKQELEQMQKNVEKIKDFKKF